MREFDLAIIGSGPAGHTAAFEAAGHGLKTILIEKNMDFLGGVCLNEGCIPLKGYLHLSGSVKDYNKIKETIAARVNTVRKGLKSRLDGLKVELLQGEAKFISKDEIECDSQRIKAKYFIIAAGSRPNRFYNNENVFSPEKVFNLEKKPEKVLIIGGGAIGCEYASFFSSLGCEISISEVENSILPGADDEVIRALSREFKKKKIKVLSTCQIKEIGSDGSVKFTSAGKESSGTYDLILEATGRKPCTDCLNLAGVGIEVTEKGFIKTDDSMRTSAGNIYAAGDCIDTPMLAYTAAAEAETAVGAIAGKKLAKIDYSKIPYLTFSFPQAGSCGLNEKQCRTRHVNVYRHFFKANGKAVVEGKDAGFLKIIEDAGTGEILGAHAVGDEIAGIINEISVAITGRIKREDIIKAMHIHPSYGEIITETLKYGLIKS